MISKNSVSKFMHKNFDFFESNNLSFFEMTVGLAFDYFSKNKVDIAIIEVGMGGRLDSTNIIKPILSVITNISIDHTRFLGSNVFDIAKEKAGIIKDNTPVVIGETQEEISTIFIDIAKSKNSQIIFADQFIYDNYDCDLKGEYQQKNIKTVLKSTEILNHVYFKINHGHIESGLNNVRKNTELSGRWQIIQYDPTIICDTAHNTAALKEVISQLLKLEYIEIHFIIGFSDDKDLRNISKIFPKESKYYYTKSNVIRGRDPIEIKHIFEESDRDGLCYPSVNEALFHARKNSVSNDIIFIGGSTFIVADALKCF